MSARHRWRASNSFGTVGSYLSIILISMYIPLYIFVYLKPTYIIPEIINSYSSHQGIPLRPRASSIISGRLAVAAMVKERENVVDKDH